MGYGARRGKCLLRNSTTFALTPTRCSMPITWPPVYRSAAAGPKPGAKNLSKPAFVAAACAGTETLGRRCFNCDLSDYQIIGTASGAKLCVMPHEGTSGRNCTRMDGVEHWTTSSLSNCGVRSNTRRFTCTTTRRGLKPSRAWADTSSSTSPGGTTIRSITNLQRPFIGNGIIKDHQRSTLISLIFCLDIGVHLACYLNSYQ